MSPSPQVTLFVTFHVKPTRISDFKAVMRSVWAACAKERECLLFDIFHDPQQPGHFRFVEVWDGDRHWFVTQQITKPYYEGLFEAIGPMLERERQVEWFERLGEGCSYRKAYLEGGNLMD